MNTSKRPQAGGTFQENQRSFERLIPDLSRTCEGLYALLHESVLEGVYETAEAARSDAVRRFGTDHVFIGFISIRNRVVIHSAFRFKDDDGELFR